jgi:MFS family permease
MALTATSFVARLAIFPLIGRVAQRRGARVVLLWGGLGVVPLPLLWLVSHDFRYLLCVQALSGAAWASLEFATMLSFFDGFDSRERASVLSAFNLATALAIGAGALAGAQLFQWFGGGPEAYGGLFAVSVAGRVATLALLRRTRAARSVPLDLRLRTLAVRPALGAVAQPVLASMDQDRPTPVEAPGAEPGR